MGAEKSLTRKHQHEKLIDDIFYLLASNGIVDYSSIGLAKL